jgi:hypothetical protein
MRKCTIIGTVIALGCLFAGNGLARASNAPVTIHRAGVTYIKGHGPGDGADSGVDSGKQRVRSNGISYHGGPVLTGTVHLYYIFYGNVSPGSQTILTSLGKSLGSSPYWNINTTYYNGAGILVSNFHSIAFGGATTDGYSQGTSFDDTGVTAIVSKAISSGKLGQADPNGVYLVVTSPDVVDTTGLYTQYCGWHTSDIIAGVDIKYGIVGEPGYVNQLNACAWQTTSPNNNAGADAAASIIAHEAEEATTDPDLNAWYDSRGFENADKCAWTFGTMYTASNGSVYNMTLGGAHYLIQRNWVNASGGYCAVHYP